METDATYRIAVERQVREYLAAAAAGHDGLRARGLGWVLREGRTEIASLSLCPLRNAGGWSAMMEVACPQALAFCQQWADGTPSALFNPQTVMATTSSAGGLPGFAGQSGVIVRAGTHDADALAQHLVERLSASGLAHMLAWRSVSASLIDDVVARAEFHAWPLQTVLYIAHHNGMRAEDPRLRDALQRRAIMRRGQRDRVLVEQVLASG
ncbi:hypothetical protein [Stenotrophomonas indicatrix]|jgi:hypothetical protein|uniref:hypothetical protein n=1 Tax=Stenotrophomonas indicatrix TaxID=2045451 RepID=UPI000E3D4DFC|nr:hypothetical protein [Stenotrophomonas indicatrix]MBO1746653.1 hypothetical protein [Stenotrophomonas indicatrix]